MSFLISLLFTFSAQAQLQPMSLQEAQSILSHPSAEVQSHLEVAPEVYTFKNNSGIESVDYSGQVLRQTLISDFKVVAASIRRGEFAGQEDQAFQTLNSFYDYKSDALKVSPKSANGATPHLIKAKGKSGQSIPVYEYYYLDILEGSKNLKSKIAGVDNPLQQGKLLGWESLSLAGINLDQDGDGALTPDEFMVGMMKVVAKNAAGKSFTVDNGLGGVEEILAASMTEEGVDLAELSQKFLNGAVSFSQAARDYLSVDLGPGKGLLADNTAQAGQAYTNLQHHWDEAFGYFGAARNYLQLDVQQVSKGIAVDSFDEGEYIGMDQGDGEISLQSEKNFSVAVYAAQRDAGAAGQDTAMSVSLMDAFLKGRHLLQTQPQDYLTYAQAFSVIALNEWEKAMAATAIHYINDLIADLESYGTQEYHFERVAKHFAEMKGFALAFQFNPSSAISLSDFEQIHNKLGDHPVLPTETGVQAYISGLKEARKILQDRFGFSDVTVKGW
ncbi:MAG: DUF4856 domain-containing protein [Bdellovibrionales bacterium]|nr:DUF4856 domain-containing protein [Bdellovibrionales bacterium]